MTAVSIAIIVIIAIFTTWMVLIIGGGIQNGPR